MCSRCDGLHLSRYGRCLQRVSLLWDALNWRRALLPAWISSPLLPIRKSTSPFPSSVPSNSSILSDSYAIILLTRCPHSHVNCWNQNKKTESITGFRLFDFHPFRRVPSMINEISVPSFVERCNNISDSIWTAGQCSRRTSLACSICASIKFPNSSGPLTKGIAASTACSRSLSVPSSGRSPQRQSFLQLPRPLKLEDCLIIWG